MIKSLISNKKKVFSVCMLPSAILSLGGCASSATRDNLDQSKQKMFEDNKIQLPRGNDVVVHNDVPFVNTKPTMFIKGSENLININASKTLLKDALVAPSETLGYTVSYTSDVDMKSKVDIKLKNVGSVEAVKQIAMHAGYVAVFNDLNKNITIAKEASRTFKIPPSIFDTTKSKYGITSSNDGKSENSDSDSSSGSSNVTTNFDVSGENSSEERAAFKEAINNILGSDQTTISWSNGLITVKGDVFALNRVDSFIKNFVNTSLVQVEVKVVIAQVTLKDDQMSGINWSKVAGGSDFSGSFNGMPSGIDATNAAFSGTITGGNSTSIIRALQQTNKVNVVAQPTLRTNNNRPATIFNGSKIPYLGKVESTMSSGSTSVSAETQYATDGLNLSIIPSALDNNLVSLKLLPSLSNVGSFSKFAFGNDDSSSGIRLEVPETFQKQIYIDVNAQSGQTIILGGTRTSNQSRAKNGLPGVTNTSFFSKIFGGTSNSDSQTELVILVTPTVIPAPQYNPFVSDSI